MKPRLRILTTFLLGVSLMYVSMGFACSKNQLVGAAQDVLSALKDAQPQITALLPGKAGAFAALIPQAEKLIAAVKASDQSTALGLVADLGPAISGFAADLHASPQVLSILALANIALHFIVNHVVAAQPPVPRSARPSPALRKAIEFKDEEEWGCKYHPDKCK